MKRALALLTTIGLAVVPVTALAASRTRSHHFTDHLAGALVLTHGSAATEAFKVTTSDVGPGAGVTVDTPTSSTGGKTVSTLYFANGSIRSTGSYHLGAAGAGGVLPVTGSGRNVGGTGVFKGAGGTFKLTGTDNPKTKTVTLTVTGTVTEPS
jgi:hypothetical protein